VSIKELGGEIYTVPATLTLHCAQCGLKLEPGDKCYIEDDSSSIFCIKHIPAPRPKRPTVQIQPDPRPLWRAYE